jgi:DNA-binding IscR family transcriptional regulator
VLRFSKKSEYGLMAVHYIAFHQQDGVVNSKRIAEDLGIPAELLAKIPPAAQQGKADRERQRGPRGATS